MASEPACKVVPAGKNPMHASVQYCAVWILRAACVLGMASSLTSCVRSTSSTKDKFQEMSERLPAAFYTDFRRPANPNLLGLAVVATNLVGQSAAPLGQGFFCGCAPLLRGWDESPRKPIPDGVAYRNVAIPKHVEIVPAGLQIRILKPFTILPGRAPGVATTFGLRGDFDITASFDNFKAETPEHIKGWGNGVGFSLNIQLAGGPGFSLSRRLRFDSEGLFWEKIGGGSQGFVTATGAAGTLRLMRAGPTLYYLWAPQAKSSDFQLLDNYDIGTNDIASASLVVFTNAQTRDVEALVREWSIRGQRENNPVKDPPLQPGATAGTDVEPKGRLMGSLLLAMLLLGIGLWLFARRRRGVPNDDQGKEGT